MPDSEKEREIVPPNESEPVFDDVDSDTEEDVDEEDVEDVSLDALSEAYARAINNTSGNSTKISNPAAIEQSVDAESEPDAGESPGSSDSQPIGIEESVAAADSDDDASPISPQTILESMLFVGSPDSQPITTRMAASLMRDVSPKEVTKLIKQLNEIYQSEGAAYRIEKIEKGYRMVLAKEFEPVRQHMYGEIREARLSQAAIEVLAVVAYNQPATRDDVDEIRLKSSGSLLNQLVRRQLLKVDQDAENPRLKRYMTTDRFLQMFAMDSIGDLPQSQLANSLDFLDS